MEIWFNERFSEDEGEPISAAVDLWNDALYDRLGTDALVFGGWYLDDEFDFEDLGDGRHVIYKIEEPTEISVELEEFMEKHWGYSPSLAGYGLHSDILIYWYRVRKGYECVLPDLECDRELTPEEEDELRERLSYYLTDLMAHELGHFIGLGHDNVNDESIMSQGTGFIYPEPIYISDADVESFCNVNDCR